jgi:uncharacterized protein (TIGR02001 family)
MKKVLIASVVSIVALTLPLTATHATEASAKVTVASNYVFRGQTQTKDGAAIQGNYDIKQSKDDKGWYAGAFASNVSSGAEIDLFGGWKGSFGQKSNMGYDVGAILYKYTDSAFSNDITELFAGVNYETAYVKLYMGSGSGIKNYNYLDIGAAFVVLKDMDLNVHFGRYLTSPSSNDVSANLSTEIKGYDLGLGLTYEDAGSKHDVEFFVTVAKKFDL